MFGIALKSLRSKWRDYIVLFVGLIISAAIFYMFSAMATNKAFLEANAIVSQITVIFVIGEVLLGIITFVYLNFANGFLLRIRQSEYGLMSMLGATKKQIGSLLLRETLSIGVIATIIGILIGFGLTSLSSHYLMNLLGVQLQHWQSFSVKSIVSTLVFFIVLFTLNGLYNRRRLRKQDTLTLLLANKQVNQPKEHKVLDPLFGLIGLALLIVSFVLMPKIAKIGLSGFVVILILNVWGTYWFVSRTLKMVTNWVRDSKYSLRGLRSFINGQLSFRLPDYQRILSSIAVMFALALGAMSVGQGYYLMLPSQAEKGDPLTAAYVTNKVSTDNLKGIAWNQDYHYVVKGQTIYFNAEEFNDQKLPAKVWSKDGSSWQTKWLTGNQLRDEPESDLTLTAVANQILNTRFGAKVVVAKNASDMRAHSKTTHIVRMVKVTDMMANEQALAHNMQLQEKITGIKPEFATGSYAEYRQLKGIFGGIEFMGNFLGIGFLAMLAATLMFKTLSGVADDKKRYRILAMIGTSEKKITKTVATDLGILFVIPMVIGILDVVFGLQMFAPLMAGTSNAYLGFLPSLIGIGGLYIIYYGLTVWMYRRLIKK
ncbi:FtsX-like permease family protein [Weissella paramesenteroides]|uniref:FtsX-like permease family protein n=1 Tax=Weissella paramesenteroides TaxID=1249 RepID=UPI003F745A81